MSTEQQIRPMGPLTQGDQAIIDALSHITAEEAKVYQGTNEAVVVDFVSNRESTPGLPKDHWSIATIETDANGNPIKSETTLLAVSSKDIDVIMRGGDISDDEIRTEEDKPKATDRAKLHDRDTEQIIKMKAAERLNKAAAILIRLQNK